MRFKRATILAGAAALLVAGTAVAADQLHKMDVALPDGSTAHIEYAGDVAPKVTVEPADPRAAVAYDPFLQLDRMAAEMHARQQQMMQQVAEMERAAAANGTAAPGQVAFVGNLPAGAHVSYFSSTTDARGCTQTVQYSSDGKSGEQPKVTRASAGNCDSATASDAAPTPTAAAPAPAPEPRRLDNKDI